MSFLNTIKNSILELVFPSSCVGCGTNGTYFCLNCIHESRQAERESESWIFPIFDYRHPPIKKALWLLKYNNKKAFAKIFAEIIHERMLEELSELNTMENFREAILLPIPLSKIRQKERGYNQAELICKELVKIDRNENFKLVTNVLIKPKDTEHQARIKNRSERLRNIVGSFSIQNGKEDVLKKKNIILVDDILTTGATLGEARRILKKSGARKVIAFTVAH